MDRASKPVPEGIILLQRQLEQFRSSRPARTKLPESLWQAAVQLARQHGIHAVAHPLRLDYTRLKQRLSGMPEASQENKTNQRLSNWAGRPARRGVHHRVRITRRRQDAYPVESRSPAGLDRFAARLA